VSKANERKRKKICDEVARLLREKREAAGLSMTRLAESAGLSHQMVSYVERGMRIPSLDTLLRMTDALGVDLAVLLAEAQRS
jgi:transcriptional regulator with XRE-family HTH domain